MSEVVNTLQSAANQAVPLEQRTDVTVEDLEKISLPHPVELYNGKVVFKNSWPPRSIVQNNISAALKSYLRHNRIGYVTVETGFQLWPDRPQELRLPDVAFLKRERVPEKASRFPKLAPDLAVEIIAPNDTCEYVFRKLDDYCKQGVKSVWLVSLNIQEVWNCTESGMAGVPVKEVLAAPGLLPGFELPVSKIFEGIPITPQRRKV